jgi:hypothetical protein
VPAALRSEYLMQLRGNLDKALALGEVPQGVRRILHFTGGSFTGERLAGEIVPGGGDWVLTRRDGASELDIRMTLRTGDGALIYLQANGLFEISPENRARIEAGEDVDPASYYFRTSQRYETSAEKYSWLNRRITVGVGRRTPSGMVTEVFSIL